MISSEINEFINKIMIKTRNNELDWRYAYDLFKDYDFNSFDKIMPRAVWELFKYCNNEEIGLRLCVQDSFYLRNKNKYLFLLHILCLPKQYRSFGEVWQLFAILDPNDKTFTPIPDYHPAGEGDRLKELCALIIKSKAAEEERKEKSLLNFFDSFL